MKLLPRSTLILVAALIVLVLLALAFWTPAQAQIGNLGVPVRCAAAVSSTPAVFACTAADGTVFANNRVPAGYYFHVTDIIIAPSSTADTQADIQMEDAGNNSTGDVLIQTSAFGTQGQHFTTPALVLPAQYRLRGLSFTATSYIAQVYGLLTKNVTYVPLIVR